MRNVRRDAMTILLLLVSGFGCATIPRNAGPPPVEGGPGETLKRLSALMQAPKVSRPAGVPAKAIPAPSSRGKSGAGTYFINLLTKMETPQRGPVAFPEPPPAVPCDASVRDCRGAVAASCEKRGGCPTSSPDRPSVTTGGRGAYPGAHPVASIRDGNHHAGSRSPCGGGPLQGRTRRIP